MDIVDIASIVVGLVLLTGGGEALVRGASALALRMGMSALVVGLTVVASATSTPELAVSVSGLLQGNPELAVGNVVGSNIANVLLILGISALVLPLTVKVRLVKLDLPFMMTLSAVLLILSFDGVVSTLDGLVLLGTLAVHTVLTIVISGEKPARLEAGETPAESGVVRMPVPRSLLFVAGGVGLLVLGANLLVEGAVSIATALGVSSLVVGLTVVAVGTSLPELAVSVIAVIRKNRDLAVGNVVGSNIVNLGLVLGLPAVLAGGGIAVPQASVALDIPLMLAAAVALLPVAFTGLKVARWEGGMFLALYAAYTVYVLLAATEHDALSGFTSVMAGFVLPLVAVTLALLTAYEMGLRKGRRDRAAP